MKKYAFIGLLLGLLTCFFSVVIVHVLLGGIVDTNVSTNAKLNLYGVLGVVIAYTVLTAILGALADAAKKK